MNDETKNTIYSKNDLINEFVNNRNVLLVGEINSQTALEIMMILLKLEQLDPDAPINLYIDSPGGSVMAGLSIIDVMESITPKVNTICYSLAGSMAAVILSSGHKRVAFKHSTVMIHQPLSGLEGFYKQTDLSERARNLEETREEIEKILANNTKGKTSFDAMHIACEKDNFLTPQEALEMGLIDEIV